MAGRVIRLRGWPGPPLSSYNEHCHNQKRESSAPFHFFASAPNPLLARGGQGRSTTAPALPGPPSINLGPLRTAAGRCPGPARRPLTCARQSTTARRAPRCRRLAPRGRTSAGSRHRPGRPRCAPRGRPAPSATVRDALGRAPDRRQPAREPRQTPAGDARRHPGNRHRGGIRTGSGPVVTRSAAPPGPRGALDRPHGSVGRGRSRPRARLSPARRLSGCPSPAHRRSDQARSVSIRSAAAYVADLSARGQSAIASSPARAERLRDPRHPPRPPPLSSRPPAKRADPLPLIRSTGFRISGSGSELGFWN